MPRRAVDPALADAVDHDIVTPDGVTLSAYTLPARPGAVPGLRIVTAHGFTNHSRRPQLTRVLRRLTAYAEVTAFDFRGHGRSGGGSTAGGDGELVDLHAAVAAARADGVRTVATLGFSMGGATVLRQAASADGRPDLTVSVSAPSRWYIRDSTAMRRVHWLLESPVGTRVSRLALRTLLGPRWEAVPTSPVDVVHGVSPSPLLIVHGTADRYFGVEHARALHRAAGGDPELWVIDGFDHAESAVAPLLATRIGRWIAATAAQRPTLTESPRHAATEEVGA